MVPTICQATRYPVAMDDKQAGAINLAEFVRATAGRNGIHADVRGGVVVASTFAVANGYVNAAVLTDPSCSPTDFFDEACAFFSALNRPFVMWLPSSEPRFLAEARVRNLVRDNDPSPGMVAHSPVPVGVGLTFKSVSDEENAAVFGDLSERAYAAPGMAYLYATQQSYSAADSRWVIGYLNDVPVTAACGFMHGTTGGIYSVATPTEFRGHGYAAAVTALATNQLFELGVTSVFLQASKLGFGVYERLGFSVHDHYERFTVTPSLFIHM
jgi:ribosomal protein S18 acetylase RimI-like enzyme